MRRGVGLAVGSAVVLASALAVASVARAEEWAPRGFAFGDDRIALTYRAEPAAEAHPGLHVALYAGAVASAQAALAAAERDWTVGRMRDRRTHVVEITDLATFVGPGHVSVLRVSQIDVGGARLDERFDAVVWDVAGDRAVTLTDFFQDAAIPPAFEAAWRDGLARKRGERFGAYLDFGVTTTELREWRERNPIVLTETPFTLEPSTEPGRIGGIRLHHAASALGPAAGRPVTVMVPAAVFAEALRPAVQEEFAGEPLSD